jgi:stress response protein YsnF
MSFESMVIRKIDLARERAKVVRPVVVVEQVRVWRSCEDVKAFDFGTAIRRAEQDMKKLKGVCCD